MNRRKTVRPGSKNHSVCDRGGVLLKITDVVRMALVKGIKTQVDMMPVFGMSSRQAMNNKFSRGSWSANDLAKVAAFTGGKLVIRYPDGLEIPVLPEDAE